jgi:hypothetical protein
VNAVTESIREDRFQEGWTAARYRFLFVAQTPIRLPEYAGSMLRGAFGTAMRRLACMTREPECSPCPLYLTCPYTLIFETPAPPAHSLQKFSAVPNPYVIEPPAWGSRVLQPGDHLIFHMVLIGQAVDKLPLIAFAWQKAFERGVGSGTARLADIAHLGVDGESSVYDQARKRLLAHDAKLVLPRHSGDRFCLNFVTPLRLQENGKALPPEKLTARVLLPALARRISLLAELHAGRAPGYDFPELVRLASGVFSSHALRWRCWTRYSNRQKTTMTLNGVVGHWELRDVPPLFHDLLHLGQWTHIGKNATFGLGHYQLERFTSENG